MTNFRISAETNRVERVKMSNEAGEQRRIPAVHVRSAACYGAGSDQWKGISGLTRKVIAHINESYGRDVAILVSSHTLHGGQVFKLAIDTAWGWKHRQIIDNDYQIVGTVN